MYTVYEGLSDKFSIAPLDKELVWPLCSPIVSFVGELLDKSNERKWVNRRVEKIEIFQPQGEIRNISLDLNVRYLYELAVRCECDLNYLPIPIDLIPKKLEQEFSVFDYNAMPTSILARDESARLSLAWLFAQLIKDGYTIADKQTKPYDESYYNGNRNIRNVTPQKEISWKLQTHLYRIIHSFPDVDTIDILETLQNIEKLDLKKFPIIKSWRTENYNSHPLHFTHYEDINWFFRLLKNREFLKKLCEVTLNYLPVVYLNIDELKNRNSAIYKYSNITNAIIGDKDNFNKHYMSLAKWGLGSNLESIRINPTLEAKREHLKIVLPKELYASHCKISFTRSINDSQNTSTAQELGQLNYQRRLTKNAILFYRHRHDSIIDTEFYLLFGYRPKLSHMLKPALVGNGFACLMLSCLLFGHYKLNIWDLEFSKVLESVTSFTLFICSLTVGYSLQHYNDSADRMAVYLRALMGAGGALAATTCLLNICFWNTTIKVQVVRFWIFSLIICFIAFIVGSVVIRIEKITKKRVEKISEVTTNDKNNYI